MVRILIEKIFITTLFFLDLNSHIFFNQNLTHCVLRLNKNCKDGHFFKYIHIFYELSCAERL